MKVVINDCFGGFSLSNAAIERYFQLKNIPYYVEEHRNWPFKSYWLVPLDQRDNKNPNHYFSEYTLERNDPVLVQVVEELGRSADGEFASLKIVEIPDDVEWTIEEYDGSEHVAEKHRTWR